MKIPSLEPTAFPAPSLHNFLSCSKSGFGSFFPLQGRRRVKEWSSEQSCSAVPGCREQSGQGACAGQYGAPPYSSPMCLLALGSMESQTEFQPKAGRMLFNTQFNLPTYLEEGGISSSGGNGESFVTSVIPQNIQLIMS